MVPAVEGLPSRTLILENRVRDPSSLAAFWLKSWYKTPIYILFGSWNPPRWKKSIYEFTWVQLKYEQNQIHNNINISLAFI